MQPNVPAEPRGYRITSAELRRLADALDTLPPGDKPPYTSLALLPDEKTADVVDALALAVGAKPGKTEPNGSGGWRHTAELWMVRERFSLTIHATVPGLADKRDAEIERLKAELAAAQAGRGSEVDDPSGTGYSEVVREPEQVEAPADITTTAYPVRGAAAGRSFQGAPIRSDESIGRPEDIGRLRAAHEPEGGPITRYFSFGHGQTDPDTGENLLDKYVTVIAPTAEGCRDAMLASRFGREWSMEYIPGTPRTDEWIARWTEHDRIVVDASTAGKVEHDDQPSQALCNCGHVESAHVVAGCAARGWEDPCACAGFHPVGGTRVTDGGCE